MSNFLKCGLLKISELKLPSAKYFTYSINHESFLSGSNVNYMEAMYQLWRSDPKQVHVSWDVYFRNVEGGQQPGEAYMSPPSLSTSMAQGGPVVRTPGTSGRTPSTGSTSGAVGLEASAHCTKSSFYCSETNCKMKFQKWH